MIKQARNSRKSSILKLKKQLPPKFTQKLTLEILQHNVAIVKNGRLENNLANLSHSIVRKLMTAKVKTLPPQ